MANLKVEYITKQAVFETIDDCNRDGLKGIFCSYDDGERFKEYIKNLPPVASHNCDDAISRQEILDEINNYRSIERKQLNEIIKNMPPVTPKGVTVTDFADRCRECGKQKTREHDKNVVLDKIRIEILKISSYNGFELGSVKDGYSIAMVYVLKIIDKYKAESEGEDGDND